MEGHVLNRRELIAAGVPFLLGLAGCGRRKQQEVQQPQKEPNKPDNRGYSEEVYNAAVSRIYEEALDEIENHPLSLVDLIDTLKPSGGIDLPVLAANLMILAHDRRVLPNTIEAQVNYNPIDMLRKVASQEIRNMDFFEAVTNNLALYTLLNIEITMYGETKNKMSPTEIRMQLDLLIKNHFASVVAARPDSFVANYNMAMAYLFRGDYEKAHLHFSKAIEGDKTVFAAQGGYNPKTGAKRPQFKDEYRVLFKAGATLFGLSAFCRYYLDIADGAIVEGRRIVSSPVLGSYEEGNKDPLALAHMFRGLCTSNNLKQKSQAAEADFEQAICLNPNVPHFYFVYKDYFLGINDERKAKEIYAQGMKVYNSLHQLRNNPSLKLLPLHEIYRRDKY